MSKRIEPVKLYDGIPEDGGQLKEAVHPKPSQLNYIEGETHGARFLAIKEKKKRRKLPI